MNQYLPSYLFILQCLDAGDGSVPGPAAPGAGLLRPARPHLLPGWLCGRSSGRTLTPPILHPRPLQQPRPTSGQSAVKLIWIFISQCLSFNETKICI